MVRVLFFILLSSFAFADLNYLESNFKWIVDSIEVVSHSINSSTTILSTDVTDGAFNGSKIDVNCYMLKSVEHCLVTFKVEII